MKIEEALKKEFPALNFSVIRKNALRVYIEINSADLMEFAEFFHRKAGLRFITASAVDARNRIEIIYHFTDDSCGEVISLRIFIKDKKNPSAASLTPLFRAADWIEREIHEMFGINFDGHPNLKHLLLGDDWPRGNYPLRRDND